MNVYDSIYKLIGFLFHVLGYTINIAAKMTVFARPSQIRLWHIYSIHTVLRAL